MFIYIFRVFVTLCLLSAFSFLFAQTPAQKETVHRQKEQLKFETATEQQVQQLFQQNGLQNQHPRQFATRTDIDRVKSLIKSGDPLMVKAWERMKICKNHSIPANSTMPNSV